MSIPLEPKLQTKLDQIARQLGKSPEEIVDEAICADLEELDLHALEEEDAAYQRLYPELRERYPQQVVAIYGGRVVDMDPDFETLFLRVQEQYGDRAVLIRRVGETSHEEYRFCMLADAQGDEIVLGRSVLNRLHLVLDGLAAVTEIVEESTV